MDINDKIENISALSTVGVINLDDYKGKKNIVLYFYPKDNTTGCTKEAMDFNAHLSEFEALDTVVIGVSIDTIDSHKKFASKYDLKFPLISDSDKKLVELFDVIKSESKRGSAKRTTFLIDKNLNIVYVWRNVKVSNHAQAVIDKIKELKL
ncbi:peroxiredoxin [Desulfurella sp.]|uniref:peroxiredoxin n=1 Tax=Desulfurella sp. TaxID=1962857 RepID=UPI0025C29CB8|nr:peroxiredoxin [Desulfurella sp.]